MLDLSKLEKNVEEYPANSKDKETKELYNKINEQEHQERIKWTPRIFYTVTGYLFLSIVLLVLSHVLKISDKVMMTFLGTTVININGFLSIVLRYLFHRNPNN